MQAHVRAKAHMERPVFASFTLDVLGSQPPMLLPSASVRNSPSLSEFPDAANDQAVSDSLKERVSTLLATEFSRKVSLAARIGIAGQANGLMYAARVICLVPDSDVWLSGTCSYLLLTSSAVAI